jgi:hypothetical protein
MNVLKIATLSVATLLVSNLSHASLTSKVCKMPISAENELLAYIEKNGFDLENTLEICKKLNKNGAAIFVGSYSIADIKKSVSGTAIALVDDSLIQNQVMLTSGEFTLDTRTSNLTSQEEQTKMVYDSLHQYLRNFNDADLDSLKNNRKKFNAFKKKPLNVKSSNSADCQIQYTIKDDLSRSLFAKYGFSTKYYFNQQNNDKLCEVMTAYNAHLYIQNDSLSTDQNIFGSSLVANGIREYQEQGIPVFDPLVFVSVMGSIDNVVGYEVKNEILYRHVNEAFSRIPQDIQINSILDTRKKLGL